RELRAQGPAVVALRIARDSLPDIAIATCAEQRDRLVEGAEPPLDPAFEGAHARRDRAARIERRDFCIERRDDGVARFAIPIEERVASRQQILEMCGFG